jgi:hypothetical protein
LLIISGLKNFSEREFPSADNQQVTGVKNNESGKPMQCAD